MKKSIKLIIVLVLSLLLFGCGTKEGYKLNELTGPELVESFDNNDNIVYATVNLSNKDGENFKRDLERVAKELHLEIYYVDSSKLNFWIDETLYAQTNIDTRKNYIYFNGKDVEALEYTNYKDLYDNLKGTKSNKISKTISDKEKEDNLKKAKEAYNEGNLSDSYNYLTTCWTLKEAKDFYKNSKYFKLINEWEYKSQNNKNIIIKKITIFDITSLLFTYEYNGPAADYKEPKAKEYNEANYLVKDDIIYLEENNEYKEKYKIISLNDDEMVIEENKIQTVYQANKKEN